MSDQPNQPNQPNQPSQPNQQSPLLTISLIGGLIFLMMGGCPQKPSPPTDQPTTPTIDRLTYVYEKDQGAVPPAISAALSAVTLSRESVVASVFEDDTTDGDNQIPGQYKIAKAAGDKYGTPLLVAEAKSVVVKVVKNPTTEAHVQEALK